MYSRGKGLGVEEHREISEWVYTGIINYQIVTRVSI
jgi:hypothetical protein